MVVVPLGSAPREGHRVEKNSGIRRKVSGRELIARIAIRAGGRMATVVVNCGFYRFSRRRQFVRKTDHYRVHARRCNRGARGDRGKGGHTRPSVMPPEL